MRNVIIELLERQGTFHECSACSRTRQSSGALWFDLNSSDSGYDPIRYLAFSKKCSF